MRRGMGRAPQHHLGPLAGGARTPAQGEAQWAAAQAFLAASKARSGEIRMGNSGPGSIWHLAHAALEDKLGFKYNAIPFGGAAPAVLALLGGHVDAVAVSPGEVATHVQSGKLKTLAVFADKRLKGFDNVPTMKERGVDIALSTWRGLAAPKATPADVLAVLADATRKTAAEPALRDTLDRLSMGQAYAEAEAFRAMMKGQNEYFKALVPKLNIKV